MFSNYVLTVGLLFSILLSMGLVQGMWQRRIVPGAPSFDWLLVFALIWPMAAMLEESNDAFAVKMLWQNLSLLGTLGLIATWLLCLVQCLGINRVVPRWGLGAVLAAPVVILGILYAFSWHSVFYGSSAQVATGVPSWDIGAAATPLWWMYSTYTLLLCGANLLLTGYAFWADKEAYTRRQVALTLGSAALASASYLASTLGLFLALPVDPTPYLFLVAALALYAVLFRPRHPTLLPEARDAAFETVLDSIIVLDPNHRVMEINPTAQHLVSSMSAFGASASFIGQPIQKLLPMWTGLMAYLHSTEKEFSTSLQVMHNNTRRYFDVQIVPLRNGSKRFLGRLLTIQETTEKEQAAEALRQRKLQLRSMVQQVQELSQHKNQVVAQLSDELSTPLTNIRFYLNLLAREQTDGQKAYLEKLHRELTHLQELLNIRHASEKPLRSAAAAPGGPQPITLNDAVCAAVRSLGEQAQLAEVAIQMDAPKQVHTVGHYRQLVRLIGNLIEHVIGHTARGGFVSVRVYQENESVFLQVQDATHALGTAAAADDSPALPRPASPDSRDVQHVPELKQARNIVDLHGGQIDVENAAAGGHRFTIRLPQVDRAQRSQVQNSHRFTSFTSAF